MQSLQGRQALEVPAEITETAAEITTTVVAAIVVIPGVVVRPRVALVEAEVAHGGEELLGDQATDEARRQAAED